MQLKEKTVANIEKNIGLSMKQIINMDTEDLDAYIAKQHGLKKIPIVDIPLQRYISEEEINRRLSRI